MSTEQTPDVRGLQRSAATVPTPTRRWRSRVLPVAAISIGALGLIAYGAWDSLVPATAVRAVSVVVKATTAGAAVGAVTVQAPGWLEPDPHPVYVSALASGVVAEVLVLEGDTVDADQVVARLIDIDARLERDSALAQLRSRRHRVKETEAELQAAKVELEHLIDHVEAVASAEANMHEIAAERDRLAADIEAAEAETASIQDELDRKSKLVASEAVPRAEVARLQLRLNAKTAGLKSLRAGLPVLAARRSAVEARLTAAQRNAELLIDERLAVAGAQARLEQARASEQHAEAVLAQAELRLGRMQVKTPVAGTVLQRLVSPGSRLDATSDGHSAHVLHLYDPARLQVRVDVPLADAARVGVDQQAQILVDALPDRMFHGVVSRLIHVADVAKNTVEVKVAITAPEPVLKPEMLARVRLLAPNDEPDDRDAGRQRVFAPLDAIIDGRAFVVAELHDGRGRVEIRVVSVGTLNLEDHVEITAGLRPGDRVIVQPNGLGEGDRITLIGETR